MRGLSEDGKSYTQAEKEAPIATWVCERLSSQLLGLIQTRHKPLVLLLSTKALDELPPRTPKFLTVDNGLRLQGKLLFLLLSGCFVCLSFSPLTSLIIFIVKFTL